MQLKIRSKPGQLMFSETLGNKNIVMSSISLLYVTLCKQIFWNKILRILTILYFPFSVRFSIFSVKEKEKDTSHEN